ncbi:hypothetical protein GCM10010251_66200 [Streptomyces aurantiogriseus]|uniref:Uncharacterized protein n=1 Tax=Streptomyces aurantiogriseus TaxID=66870 RepID=A0A918FIL5_9ACTN|nr:hypothetical protein GCM10010251_66200 [Streptomyces aurantiogriseus]
MRFGRGFGVPRAPSGRKTFLAPVRDGIADTGKAAVKTGRGWDKTAGPLPVIILPRQPELRREQPLRTPDRKNRSWVPCGHWMY